MDFFNGLQNYFATLDQDQWWYVLSMVALAFIVGLLIAYILRGFTVRRYRKALLLAERGRTDAEAQYQSAKLQQEKLAKELATTSQARIEAMDRADQLAGSLQLAQAEKQRLSTELEQARASRDSYAQTIEDLNNQLSELNAELEQQQTRQPDTAAGTMVVQPLPERDIAPLPNSNADLEARLAALEAQLAQIGDKTTAAQNQSSTFTTQRGDDRNGYHQPVIEQLPVEPDDYDEPTVIRADITEAGPREGEGGQTEVIVARAPSRQVEIIQIPDESDRDDLKKIKTIGPFLEEQLNKLGIYTYRQIAGWDDKEVERMTRELSYLPGRIAADDWVGQAQSFASTVVVPEATTQAPKGFRPDKLQIVDGIGPKIESVLKANGIDTLAELAEQDEETLRAMLQQAGSRFRVHDPSSWPAQAALARDGQWDELEALQEAI